MFGSKIEHIFVLPKWEIHKISFKNYPQMKRIIILAAVMLCFVTVGFAQAEQTIVKSLVADMNTAVLELPGEVSTSLWDKDFIRITATIKVTNNSDEILKKLVGVGRYDIQTAEKDGQLVITMPKVAHNVIIKGVNLSELIKFEVQLPYHVKGVIKKPDFYNTQQSM